MAAPTAPGPRGTPLLGHLRILERDPLGFLLRIRREYGDVVRLRLGLWHGLLVAHPDGVRHVLQEHHANYDKHTFDFRLLKPVLGEGLLTSDGATWLRQRRLMQPAFHRQRIAAFGRLMVERTEHMLARWDAVARQRGVLDVAAEMNRLTLDVVTRALFGTDVGREADEAGRAVTLLNELFMQGFASPRTFWMLATGRPVGAMRGPTRTLDRIVQGIIAARRARAAGRDDLLSLLLDARDEDGGPGLGDRELRDQVLTLFVAGHETTSNALAWTWHLLAAHPDAAERLRAELAAVLGGRSPGIDDLPRLPYTRMVLDESMRLYPPAWATSRNPVADDVIGGHRVPKGTLVFLSPWVTHRHPDVWADPERFDPERFTPARTAARPRFAYFPFGGGPHLCIGNTFALTEAVLVLATVAQRVRLAALPGRPVVPAPLITLRPRDGLPMTVAPAA